MTVLVWLALLALPVHAMRGVPVQPAELLALPLIVLAARRFRHGSRSWKWTTVDAGVLAWALAVVVAGATYFLRHGSTGSVLVRDVSATVYLTVLYFAIRVLADEDFVARALTAFVVGVGLAAALGILGFLASVQGVSTPLALDAHSPYPYLGHAARARALTATPNMLASIVTTALLLLAARVVRLPAVARNATCATLGAALLLTLSKTFVALAAGALTLRAFASWSRLSKAARIAVAISWVAALAVFVVFTHVVVACEGGDREILERGMYISGEPFARFAGGRCSAHATSYWYLKQTSTTAILQSWPWGIGPGNHSVLVARLQEQGQFPRTMYHSAPHSSYTGALAESGLAGGLGLAAFLAGLALGIRDSLRQDATRQLGQAAAAVFAVMLIEATATDVMHFRHYTWLAALVGWAAARPR